jgi:hypothetical protein
MSQIQAVANIYRPQAGKPIALGVAWAKGSTINLNGQVDLSTPILGMRFVLKGRITITTAAYTSVKPEQLLNLIQELKIFGTNSRQGGNVTVHDMDVASWLGFTSLMRRRAFNYLVNKGASTNCLINIYGTPVGGYGQNGTTQVPGFDGTASTFDFILAFDVPFGPMATAGQGGGFAPGWAMRQSEWADSVQIYAKFASLGDNQENEIGVSAATSVTSVTSYGSATGSPTLDVYSLPNIAAKVNDANILPGVISRASQNVSAYLVSGNNIALAPNLQKQNTARVFFKTGVATLFPNFSSLSDTIITAAGITVAANKPVRNLIDVFAHKLIWQEGYDTDPITGYLGFDFLNSQNPFSAYAGANQNVVGAGATFQLVANVAAIANNALDIMQEQMLYLPSGPLYNS